MNPQEQFCPNVRCHASGRKGGGNIVMHSQKQRRYKCRCCGKTFSERHGTSLYRVKKASEQFVLGVSLLSYGCPVQVRPGGARAAFGLDERTVRSWLHKAGRHAQQVHEAMMSQQAIDLQQVQADEIRIKMQGNILWMAMALMVSTRLWLGGVVSERRDMRLARCLAAQIRHIALARPLLLAVDGWKSYVCAFQQAFRMALYNGQRGRPRLQTWPQLLITQVVKRRQGRTLTIERRIVQGTQALAAPFMAHLLTCSQPGGVINTAYIAPRGHPLNATFRQRLNCLARRTRTLARTSQTVNAAMFLLGCVYNFCTAHHSLSLTTPTTPAMAAGITDPIWSMHEFLYCKIPTTYQPVKRRGRPPKFACSCDFL